MGYNREDPRPVTVFTRSPNHVTYVTGRVVTGMVLDVVLTFHSPEELRKQNLFNFA
jgi:hypothetical protein